MFKPLLRTLPLLSGNVSLLCIIDDITKNNDIYETYIRHAKLVPLQNSLYNQDINVNLLTGSWEHDVKKMYKYYTNVFYDTNFNINYSDYKEFDMSAEITARNKDYEYGCKRTIYQAIGKQFIFYAPIYIDSVDDIPESFDIYISFSDNYIKHLKIYINQENSKNYLYNYIQRYVAKLDDNVIYLLHKTRQAMYYGIDVINGGFVSVKDNEISKCYSLQQTINDFDYVISEGFKRNNVIMKQILPLSFAFDISDICDNYVEELYNKQIYISGYYTTNGIKQSFYDFSIDYKFFSQQIQKYNVSLNKFDLVSTGTNIMDVQYPSLHESNLLDVTHDNIISPSFTRWKLKYSDDNNPYIVNINYAFSYNCGSNYNYYAFPEQAKIPTPTSYIFNENLIVNSSDNSDYMSMINTNNTCIFDNKWYNVIDNKCLYHGVLFDLSKELINTKQKIDKFGVFVDYVVDNDLMTSYIVNNVITTSSENTSYTYISTDSQLFDINPQSYNCVLIGETLMCEDETGEYIDITSLTKNNIFIEIQPNNESFSHYKELPLTKNNIVNNDTFIGGLGDNLYYSTLTDNINKIKVDKTALNLFSSNIDDVKFYAVSYFTTCPDNYKEINYKTTYKYIPRNNISTSSNCFKYYGNVTNIDSSLFKDDKRNLFIYDESYSGEYSYIKVLNFDHLYTLLHHEELDNNITYPISYNLYKCDTLLQGTNVLDTFTRFTDIIKPDDTSLSYLEWLNSYIKYDNNKFVINGKHYDMYYRTNKLCSMSLKHIDTLYSGNNLSIYRFYNDDDVKSNINQFIESTNNYTQSIYDKFVPIFTSAYLNNNESIQYLKTLCDTKVIKSNGNTYMYDKTTYEMFAHISLIDSYKNYNRYSIKTSSYINIEKNNDNALITYTYNDITYAYYKLTHYIDTSKFSFNIDSTNSTNNNISYLYDINLNKTLQLTSSTINKYNPYLQQNTWSYILQNTCSMLKPTRLIIPLRYITKVYDNGETMQSYMFSYKYINDNKNIYDIVTQVTNTKLTLYRYIDNITPLITKTNELGYIYQYKYKSINSSIPINTISYSNINIYNNTPTYVVTKYDYNTHSDISGEYIDEVEYKHFNNSYFFNLKPSYNITLNKNLNYDELLEAESEKNTCDILFNTALKLPNLTKYQKIFLYNRYKINYISSKNINNKYSLIYQFRLK